MSSTLFPELKHFHLMGELVYRASQSCVFGDVAANKTSKDTQVTVVENFAI